MTRASRLMQPMGAALAAVGVGLMVYAGPFARIPVRAPLLTTVPAHVDWCLLTGMAVVIAGGLLAQAGWSRRSA